MLRERKLKRLRSRAPPPPRTTTSTSSARLDTVQHADRECGCCSSAPTADGLWCIVGVAGDRLGVLGQVEALGQVVRKRASAVSCHALDRSCGARACAVTATRLPIRSRVCVCRSIRAYIGLSSGQGLGRESYSDTATERPRTPERSGELLTLDVRTHLPCRVGVLRLFFR